MPRYFFSIQYGGQTDTFDEGLELADKAAAWKEATKSCGEVLRDIDGAMKPGEDWEMTVSDEKQKPVFKLRVSSEAFG